MASVDLLVIEVGKIEAEAIFLVRKHEAESNHAVLEFGLVSYRNRVIGRRMEGDVHRAVLEVDLLVSVRPLYAVGAPTLADLLFLFL